MDSALTCASSPLPSPSPGGLGHRKALGTGANMSLTSSHPPPATPLPTLTLRLMATGDLSQVLDLEQQCPSPRWTLEHFLVDFQSNAITRLVVSTPSQVVGFLACR